MHLNWNLLGILIWIAIFVVIIFVIRNIRQRHLRMIVVEQKTFSWKTLAIDTIEVLGIILAMSMMLYLSVVKSPDLTNQNMVTKKISYQSLILTPGVDKSYYVDAKAKRGKNAQVSFEVLSEGHKLTINSRNSSISDGDSPLSVEASVFPFDKKELIKKDNEFQKAYLAIYESKYKNTILNGLGLNVGKNAKKYYLIRIPDETFYHETIEE